MIRTVCDGISCFGVGRDRGRGAMETDDAGLDYCEWVD